mgnify:FL=1
MGMINLGSSLRYSMNGKRRKKHAANPVKKKRVANYTTTRLKPDFHAQRRLEEAKAHKEKYPSMMEEMIKNGTFNSTGGSTGRTDDYKKEISKGYTVAPAYNKGAYQVIPKGNIKDIGR